MVAVAHICKRFAMDFANDILADSDFDLAIDVHGGAHWEAISDRFPKTIALSMLVSIWLPMAMVAHFGKRLGDRFWF